MIDISTATIDSIIIHKIGCKTVAENDPRYNNFYSQHEIQFLNEDTQSVLKSYFEKVLKSNDSFYFNTDNSAVQNEVARVFEQKANFYTSSVKMAEKLYNVVPETVEACSEFYVVYFSNCVIDEDTTNAVGLFMSDAKETFLKIMQNDNEVNFQAERGINIKKIDKGCFIFNTQDGDSSYFIKAIDNTKGEDVYWIDSFLELKIIENNYFNTENFFKICRDFNENVLASNENVKNQERVAFLKNSLAFFETNQTFDEEKFNKEVIGNEEIANDFNDFKQRYRKQFEVEAPSSFDIDETAVKKSKKYLRSVIKLDKNFHIYVHSRPEFLKKGYDQEKGKSYYQVFFDIES